MIRARLLSRILGSLLVSTMTVATAGLDNAQADRFARMALAGLDREYPYKPGDVLSGPQDVRPPREVHPAFWGNFDWHSSVHGHWLLVRLLRLHPEMEAADEARAALERHLTVDNLAAETAYFDVRENRGFERLYGWAWLLRLAAELHDWDDADARRWAMALRPLETRLVALTMDYLPRLSYPIRTGVHQDTAFALAQILDYARSVGNEALATLIAERARSYYLGDRNYPVSYEPSGEDFFSPGLNVADLLRRILPAREFHIWLLAWLPGLRSGELGNWAEPATVSDLSDPRIVHLVGLNLSRAWTMQGIASVLPVKDRARKLFTESAARHSAAGQKYVFSGHYEGEHWLATFAVYQLTRSGVDVP